MLSNTLFRSHCVRSRDIHNDVRLCTARARTLFITFCVVHTHTHTIYASAPFVLRGDRSGGGGSTTENQNKFNASRKRKNPAPGPRRVPLGRRRERARAQHTRERARAHTHDITMVIRIPADTAHVPSARVTSHDAGATLSPRRASDVSRAPR